MSNDQTGNVIAHVNLSALTVTWTNHGATWLPDVPGLSTYLSEISRNAPKLISIFIEKLTSEWFMRNKAKRTAHCHCQLLLGTNSFGASVTRFHHFMYTRYPPPLVPRLGSQREASRKLVETSLHNRRSRVPHMPSLLLSRQRAPVADQPHLQR